MGFGSYDESERENRQAETDLEEDGQSTLPIHDGDVEFEYAGTSSGELLETYREIRNQ